MPWALTIVLVEIIAMMAIIERTLLIDFIALKTSYKLAQPLDSGRASNQSGLVARYVPRRG